MIDARSVRLLPLGDRALLAELGDALDPALNARARGLAARLRGVAGVEEAVPALQSVLVTFDPLSSDLEAVAESVQRLAAAGPAAPSDSTRAFEVPVVYGGAAGPDLEEVASLCALTPRQVIELHSGVEHTVFMLGFAPGYPYLGILPGALRVRRLPSPRLRVPEGSVAIADAMSGIYPLSSPGGWRIIGRTPLRIYDPHEAAPVLFRPGDRVRFVPVDRAEFPDRAASPPLRVPDRAIFEVRSPGLYSTVQDPGRPGYRMLGIPVSGAMDPLALALANAAVGNPPGAPALEVTAPGPVLAALEHVSIALAGADLSVKVDGTPVESAAALALRPGHTVTFGAPRAGVWAYLAVAGGFEAIRALGSAATYVPGLLGGSGGRRLREGDVLGVAGPPRRRPAPARTAVPLPREDVTVRVIPGPQDEWLTQEARAAFLKEVYRVSAHSDRAGTRLDGPALAHRGDGEFLSDGVIPGAIQVPSGGAPIVIMPDGPTTGGYPKVAAVISADARMVAQARPGTRVRFRAVSMEEAVEALRERLALLEGLAAR